MLETDSHEFSTMINDYEKSSAFRKETIRYIQAVLTKSDDIPLSHISTNPIITNFEHVAEAILKRYSQSKRFSHTLYCNILTAYGQVR